MVRLPVRVPTAVGLNPMLIVQLACGATLLAHVLAGIVKSPDTTMLATARAVVPVFFRTTFFEPLVVPRTCTPKVKLVGERLTIGNP